MFGEFKNSQKIVHGWNSWLLLSIGASTNTKDVATLRVPKVIPDFLRGLELKILVEHVAFRNPKGHPSHNYLFFYDMGIPEVFDPIVLISRVVLAKPTHKHTDKSKPVLNTSLSLDFQHHKLYLKILIKKHALKLTVCLDYFQIRIN